MGYSTYIELSGGMFQWSIKLWFCIYNGVYAGWLRIFWAAIMPESFFLLNDMSPVWIWNTMLIIRARSFSIDSLIRFNVITRSKFSFAPAPVFEFSTLVAYKTSYSYRSYKISRSVESDSRSLVFWTSFLLLCTYNSRSITSLSFKNSFSLIGFSLISFRISSSS